MISDSTVRSWWVPYEIGSANEIGVRITSYDRSSSAVLPDFLTIWPVITNTTSLDAFIRRYLPDRAAIEKSSTKTFSEAVRAPIQSADDFHRMLKADLGQSK